MAKRNRPAPFDLKDSQLKGQWSSWQDVANWLAIELDTAIASRGAANEEIRYCWDYYEQNRMRGRNAPWPDAADLPSPLAPEYTDAVHARLHQIVAVKPMWTVEGYGEAATRAPFVEEFHQRAQEDERLQTYLDEWMLRGLVEGVGTLEVCEAYDMRRTLQRRKVKIEVDPVSGMPINGEDGQPVLARDPESGDYLDAESEQEPSAEVEVDQWEPVRLGPAYDVIPYLDFFVLPAHARHNDQIWGHAKRFHRRLPQLAACVERGDYDKEAVERIGTADEASNGQGPAAPAMTAPVPQDGMTAQKELFECQILANFDGKGERWWRLTLHKDTRTLLRAKMDDQTTRYIRWRPFPKPGTVDRGYSLIGHKLITVIEEDTARRNMTADRMALVIGQPIKRMQGALWDPYEQPFGPRTVIDVRDMNEVQPMQGIQDVPSSVMLWRNHLRDDGDRLIGQNDVARGVIAEESKPTATQVATTAQAAEVRISVIRARMQEALEELGQARHTIWLRTLQANPHLPVRRSMVLGRNVPGVEAAAYPQDNRITAQMLEGTFWFIPRGSVDNADPMRQRSDLNGLLQVLPALFQMNPAVAQIFGTIPAAKALVEQILRVYRWPDRQSFLGSEADDVFSVMQRQQEQQRMQQQMLADPRMQLLMAAAGQPGEMPGLPAGGGMEQPMGGEPTPPQGVM